MSLLQVSDGFVEFKPSPAENRALMRSQYVVPATLMVKFLDDSIDESEEMTRLLQQVQPLGAVFLLYECMVRFSRHYTQEVNAFINSVLDCTQLFLRLINITNESICQALK